MSNTDTAVTPLDLIDQAVTAVEEARALLPAGTPLTGEHPNQEGHVGQALHDLRVLRGRVADHA